MFKEDKEMKNEKLENAINFLREMRIDEGLSQSQIERIHERYVAFVNLNYTPKNGEVSHIDYIASKPTHTI